jgi:hypothetical protein
MTKFDEIMSHASILPSRAGAGKRQSRTIPGNVSVTRPRQGAGEAPPEAALR